MTFAAWHVSITRSGVVVGGKKWPSWFVDFCLAIFEKTEEIEGHILTSLVTRVFWVAKIVAKIIRTLMLRRFCNPSCTTYRGTGSVIDIMICDHGVYHDTWSYFVILWPLLQPKVARKVAKRDGFCNLLQLTCDEKETFGTYHMVTYGHEEERSSLRAWGE